MAAIADRNLLFGLLALQNGLLNQGQLVSAFQAWTLDKGRDLADHFVGRGDLDTDDRSAVNALVARHVKKHGGEVEQSLAAVSAGRSTRESLADIADSDVEATLARLGSVPTQHDGGAEQTLTYAVGETTSEGQRFRVLRPHAKGGLGAVFVALDSEIHREVALKQILDKHADDPISRQRFLLEAEVTGGLEHPGIVPVYGLGSYANGRPFYAMRFIRGDSLKEAVDRFHAASRDQAGASGDTLELRKLLGRFVDVCNAIEYAHSRGVLHRDIKPGNVIVGKHGETLVVDWGLAKAMGRADPGSGERTLVPSHASGSSDTLPGSAMGTPAYISPEQASGDLDRLGPRSDVYGLGATLYYLLVGKAPFDGDVADILRKVQRGEFAAPRQCVPTINHALESICLKAMAARPESRYDSPKSLAEDLERWMADEPVSAWREPWTRKLLRWLTRHRLPVTAAGAALLVALIAAAVVLGVQSRANATLKTANLDLAIANSKIGKANTDLAAANDRERARFALAQEAIRKFHTGVSEDVLLKQEEFSGLRAKFLRDARDFYRKLEGLLQGQNDRGSRLALGRAYHEVGELSRRLDSIAEAEEVERRAMVLLEQLIAEDSAATEPRLVLARCLRELSVILTGTGNGADALAAIERSREIIRILSDANGADRELKKEWAEIELLYAMMLDSNHRSEEALAIAQRLGAALESRSEATGASDRPQPELAEFYGALAIILDSLGRTQDALAAYQKARDLGEAVFRSQSEDATDVHELVRTLGNMGLCLAVNDRHGEAVTAFEQARGVIKVAGRAHPTLTLFPAAAAWIEGALGEELSAMGREVEALEALDRSRTLREVLIKANPAVTRNRDQLLRVHRQAAGIHRRAGKIALTVTDLEKALEIHIQSGA